MRKALYQQEAEQREGHAAQEAHEPIEGQRLTQKGEQRHLGTAAHDHRPRVVDHHEDQRQELEDAAVQHPRFLRYKPWFHGFVPFPLPSGDMGHRLRQIYRR